MYVIGQVSMSREFNFTIYYQRVKQSVIDQQIHFLIILSTYKLKIIITNKYSYFVIILWVIKYVVPMCTVSI